MRPLYPKLSFRVSAFLEDRSDLGACLKRMGFEAAVVAAGGVGSARWSRKRSASSSMIHDEKGV